MKKTKKNSKNKKKEIIKKSEKEKNDPELKPEEETEKVKETEETPAAETENAEANRDGKLKFTVKSAIRRTAHTQIFKCFLIALVLEFVMEILGRRSLFDAVFFVWSSPIVFVYNTSIIFFTLLFALFIRKRWFGIIFISMIWLTCGFVNFSVLGYRVTPFAAIDILMARDVLSMLDVYFEPWQLVGFVILGVVVVIGLILLFRKSPKVEGAIHVKRTMLVCLLVWLFLFGFTKLNIKYNIISDDFANLGMAYKDYGFAYCFTNSIIDNGINKPDGYSEQEMLSIRDALEAGREDKNEEAEKKNNKKTGKKEKELKKPNVIVIQLESFFDPKTVKGLHLAEDPVKNFTSYKEQFPSGFFRVPALGAGTANTEFEVLTGIKSSYFGAGEYPYKTTMNKTPCVSMCSILAGYGYGTYAIHNNTAVFYDRRNVYDQMGFDNFISMEFMYDLQFTPTHWAKDVTIPTDILRCLDQTEGSDFVFTISVQGHGRYPDRPYTDDVDHVQVTYDEKETEQQFHYYLNQIYEMDQMIGELKDALDARGEDYILLLYGDHLPSLNITDEKLTAGNVFQTEYVLVNNINLDMPDRDILASEVSNRIIDEALGFDLSYEQLAHKLYEGEELDRVSTLVAYDMLYGKNYIYDGAIPVPAAHMKLGVLPIRITGIKNEQDHMVVKGENFNIYSMVFADGERLETVYIDSENLMVNDMHPKSGVAYCVHQIDKNKKDIAQTDDFYVY